MRPEEQCEKAESYRENSWNEIQLKGPYRQAQSQEQNKKEWASLVGLFKKKNKKKKTNNISRNIPTT